MQALKRDAMFVARVLAGCALAGAGLLIVFGPLIIFARIQCG
jgi:hypothetical protein